MKAFGVLICFFLFLSAEPSLAADPAGKKKVVWLTYMETADIDELAKLKILLINEAISEKPNLGIEPTEKHLAAFLEDFEKQRALRQMSVFSMLNYFVPSPILKSNEFNRYASAIILREWKSQNTAFYKSAQQKYNNYNLNEIQFSHFSFDNDSIYNQVWSTYHASNKYRILLKDQINLALWPDFVQTSETFNIANFNNLTRSYLKYFKDDGSINVPPDTVRRLLEKQITLYENDLKIKINIEISSSPNGDSRDVFLNKLKDQREEEVKLVKNLRQGSSVLEKLLGEFDPVTARKAGIILDNTTNVYEAWSKWKHDYSAAEADEDELKLLITNIALGQGVIGAVMNIHNLLSKSTPQNTDAIILKELRVLNAKIEKLSVEMHDRFDVIDQNLVIIFESMNNNFRNIFLDLANITYVSEQTRNDLLDAKKQLDNIESDMLTYLQSVSQVQLKQNLTYYLDHNINFQTNTDIKDYFKKGINEFADWGISFPKEKMYAGGPDSYEMDDNKIPVMIRKFSKSDMYDINYFIQYTNARFGKVYSGINYRRSNQNIWNLGSEAFLDMALEWKDLYKQHVTANLVDQLIDNGEELIQNYNSILKSNSKVDTVLFDNFIRFNKQALEALKSKFETQNKFAIASYLNKDPNFSVWKINPLNVYRLKFPLNAEYTDSIKHDYSTYQPDVVKVANSATHIALGFPLSYSPQFGVDSSNILKYADILNLGALSIKYNYWEYRISEYRYRGIDIDPGRLTFAPTFTRMTSGFMIAEARFGNRLIYKRAGFMPGVYLRSNTARPELYLASARAVAGGALNTIPYSYLRKDYKSLFADIWEGSDGIAKERFFYPHNKDFPDSVRGVSGYRPYHTLRALKCDVMGEMLKQQNILYNNILKQDADFDSEYNTLNGAHDLYLAFFNLGMPNIIEYDSVRSYLYGKDKLMNTEDFKKILREFVLLNQKILEKRSQRSTINTDILIKDIVALYDSSKFVKPHFKLTVTKYNNDFCVTWNENIFSSEILKIDGFQTYAHKLLRRIDRGAIIVNYPKVEPILSKLYNLKSYFHN